MQCTQIKYMWCLEATPSATYSQPPFVNPFTFKQKIFLIFKTYLIYDLFLANKEINHYGPWSSRRRLLLVISYMVSPKAESCTQPKVGSHTTTLPATWTTESTLWTWRFVIVFLSSGPLPTIILTSSASTVAFSFGSNVLELEMMWTFLLTFNTSSSTGS